MSALGSNGIDADLGVFAGYDNVIEVRGEFPRGPDPPLTAAERQELAEIMIDRWQRWKTCVAPDRLDADDWRR